MLRLFSKDLREKQSQAEEAAYIKGLKLKVSEMPVEADCCVGGEGSRDCRRQLQEQQRRNEQPWAGPVVREEGQAGRFWPSFREG